MFSRTRYSEFEKFQIPEIFRVPLEELCLQSKYLAPKGVSIAEFIGQVPEAPNALAIHRAVQVTFHFLSYCELSQRMETVSSDVAMDGRAGPVGKCH